MDSWFRCQRRCRVASPSRYRSSPRPQSVPPSAVNSLNLKLVSFVHNQTFHACGHAITSSSGCWIWMCYPSGFIFSRKSVKQKNSGRGSGLQLVSSGTHVIGARLLAGTSSCSHGFPTPRLGPQPLELAQRRRSTAPDNATLDYKTVPY